ncbi:hypothetical protein HA41_08885 [Pantoea conspicua]|uniref:Uncharacterized protein n=1 Tax=Pantoea conspicua TaxID=472705 RepID=A0A1X1BXE2_9GAMM|nr:hypothetical protein HA41_08885 [Pantoea conspicua]
MPADKNDPLYFMDHGQALCRKFTKWKNTPRFRMAFVIKYRLIFNRHSVLMLFSCQQGKRIMQLKAVITLFHRSNYFMPVSVITKRKQTICISCTGGDSIACRNITCRKIKPDIAIIVHIDGLRFLVQRQPLMGGIHYFYRHA